MYNKKVDGVSRGSPVLQNVFLSYDERNWLHEFDTGEVLLFRRYVEDVFCIFQNENDLEYFLST